LHFSVPGIEVNGGWGVTISEMDGQVSLAFN